MFKLKRINKVSVIGLGAIGAAYASKLHDLNPNCVQVIADEERIRRYKSDGLWINGRRCDFNYLTPEVEAGPADLVLVAVKYQGLQQAIADIKHHVGPETVIMSLMNGISSEEIIAHTYGSENLLYAMCVAIDAGREGTDISFSSIGRICFGEKRNPSHSPKVRSVKQLFEQAGIPYEIPENMEHAMWWKFMINVGINQTSAVLKAPYRVFQEIREAHDLMVTAMQEVIELSKKADVHLNEGDLAAFDLILRQSLSPEGKTSMLQDIEAGRKTEVEYFAGTVCQLGRRYGVPTPVNEMLFRMIRVLEQVNGRG